MGNYFVDLARGAIEDNGFEVVQIKNHPRHLLRAWVDREPEGVSSQDCGALMRSVRKRFEEDGLDPGDFQIEVLSPGLDRVLVREKDFVRFAGREVRLRLKERAGARRNFKGALVGLVDGRVVLRGEEEWSFPRADVAEVRLVPEVPAGFEGTPKPEKARKPRKSRRKRPKEH